MVQQEDQQINTFRLLGTVPYSAVELRTKPTIHFCVLVLFSLGSVKLIIIHYIAEIWGPR